MKFICLFVLAVTMSVFANTTIIVDELNFETSLNEAIENARGETTIELPSGKFFLNNEVIIDRPGITILGKGPKETILSFKKQKAGPQGIIATKDQLALEGFTVEDSFGNAIKAIGINHATFKNLRVRWTRGASKRNGAYGLYPVLSRNILIENCEVSDASDAGIYVGQSDQIIVRYNNAHNNVAGIEIENSDDADVYENEAHHNTAGILVFNLPDLVKKVGRRTKVHHNKVHNNNKKNFSTEGSIINLVPKGLGVFSLAAQQLEISNNNLYGNSMANIAISHYAISERPIKDPSYDPKPKGISIFENRFKSGYLTFFDGTKMNFILKVLGGLRSKDIIYDGIEDGTYEGERSTGNDRICITRDSSGRKTRFANLHLDNKRPLIPFPGGPVTRSIRPYECELPVLKTINLKTPEILPAPRPIPTMEEVEKVCKIKVNGVNWSALNYDCPELSDYNLFQDPKDPTQNPVEGFKYLLKNQLFTDYAEKDRFIFLPPGTAINYKPKYALDFPVGSVISKTFSITEVDKETPTLMETRLLIRREDGWIPLNYVWDQATGKALLSKAGLVVSKKIIVNKLKKIDIDYHVPSLRQCASCHFVNEKLTPIGPQAKFLNRPSVEDEQINQLTQMAISGRLQGLPDVVSEIPAIVAWDDVKQTIDSRAKAYLEINCAHCHNAKGNARNTGLFLQSQWPSDSIEIGHCKTPVAAGFATGGNSYAIAPGRADKSIMMYRMSQSHLAVKMPQLGRSVSHSEGNELVRDWINQMKKIKCQ